jgi:hypothetical protein
MSWVGSLKISPQTIYIYIGLIIAIGLMLNQLLPQHCIEPPNYEKVWVS